MERIWHKNYIKALPKRMLVRLFRNLSEIAIPGNMSVLQYKKKINEFNKSHFYNYCCEVYDELQKRDLLFEEQQVIDEWKIPIYKNVSDEEKQIGASIAFKDLFEKPVSFMNERMLVQHYYIFQEMYDLGDLSDDEFNLLEQVYNEYFY